MLSVNTPFHLAPLLLATICLPVCAQEIGSNSSRKDTVKVDEKTEAVIKGALKYLAAQQSPNGAWAVAEEEKRHPIAITGYVLMAFQEIGRAHV